MFKATLHLQEKSFLQVLSILWRQPMTEYRNRRGRNAQG